MAKRYEMELGDYLRIARRRKEIIIMAAAAVFAITYMIQKQQIPRYRTSTTIEVTKAIATEGMERWLYYKGHPIETSIKQMRSRACIEAALREMKVISDSSTEAEITMRVGEMLSVISISQEPNTNIIAVAAVGENKDSLPKYVNALCRVYKRLEKEWDQRSDDEVIDFLNARIQYFKERREKAEAASIEFQRAQLNRGVSQQGFGELFKKKAELKLEEAKLTEEIDEIRYRVNNWQASFNPEVAKLVQERREAEAQRLLALAKYTDAHPEVQRFDEKMEKLDTLIAQQGERGRGAWEQAQMASIDQKRGRLAQIQAQLDEMDQAIDQLPREQIIQTNIGMELTLSRGLYEMFWQRIEQQKIARQSKSGGVNLQGDAGAAIKIYPSEKAQYSIGITMALLFGLAAGFIWEILDTSIRTIEEVEEYVGIPVLGVVPKVIFMGGGDEEYEPLPGRPSIREAGSIVHYEPRDPVSEAVRALASSLDFTFFNEGHRVLLVASATPQEGKTTTVANLGVALANSGKKTLLLDCNLRHPGISKLYNLSGHAGMSEVLEGIVPWRTCTYPTSIENLDIIPTGPLPGRPVELLKTALPGLLREITIAYDSIVIDSPPILPVADGCIISAMAGGTLIIYSQGHAPRDVILRAKTKLETAKGRVIGLVLNKVRPEGELGRNYYYYYYTYYPSAAGGGRKRG